MHVISCVSLPRPEVSMLVLSIEKPHRIDLDEMVKVFMKAKFGLSTQQTRLGGSLREQDESWRAKYTFQWI